MAGRHTHLRGLATAIHETSGLMVAVKRLAAGYRNAKPLCQTNDGIIWSVVSCPSSVVQIVQTVQIVKSVQFDLLFSNLRPLISLFPISPVSQFPFALQPAPFASYSMPSALCLSKSEIRNQKFQSA
jgi:hypothetical protein